MLKEFFFLENSISIKVIWFRFVFCFLKIKSFFESILWSWFFSWICIFWTIIFLFLFQFLIILVFTNLTIIHMINSFFIKISCWNTSFYFNKRYLNSSIIRLKDWGLFILYQIIILILLGLLIILFLRYLLLLLLILIIPIIWNVWWLSVITSVWVL